ncbi:hypothetical protein B0H19DRAFT_1265087 [Mycena capillaripes]|nr:hypothetical protein B0H19DRAFT_1265087 [Mycena capillaripes]
MSLVFQSLPPPHMDHEPVFPDELEREIFETTALMHPGDIPTLLRVARRHGRCSPVRNGIEAAQFFYAVRHLSLETHSFFSQDEANALLKLCKKVTDFNSNYLFTHPSFITILAGMHVGQLALTLKHLFGSAAIDITHPLFHADKPGI